MTLETMAPFQGSHLDPLLTPQQMLAARANSWHPESPWSLVPLTEKLHLLLALCSLNIKGEKVPPTEQKMVQNRNSTKRQFPAGSLVQ